MNSLWWFALPVLLLPIWWHRQRRVQVKAKPLATARFLPRAEPKQVRVWRWTDIVLLIVRCLLLATAIAWLANPVLPWRGDTVIVVEGTDPAWAAREIVAAGLKDAERITVPAASALAWLRSHEREWRAEARLLVLGDVPMAANRPQFAHRVELRTQARPPARAERHIAAVSERAGEWRKLFTAVDGPDKFVFDAAPGSTTELIIWDTPQAPGKDVRAPLWWVVDAGSFPELRKAREVDGVRYADSRHGRLWSAGQWPPKDAAQARELFGTWQRLHHAPRPFTAPPQVLDAGKVSYGDHAEGALRDILLMLLAGLFALERILTHVRRR